LTDPSLNTKPIGIFDSGIGGLTVLREVAQRMPNEDIIYLGDTARVPYGIRSPETVVKYTLQNASFLMRQGIKILIVACNTASAVGIEKLREEIPLPVIGVIEPGAKAALEHTSSGRIGVIGTQATISSGAYQNILKGLRNDTMIVARACPLFVPVVEEGWTSGPIAEAIVREYLSPLKGQSVDTLVLGCTHYPLLKDLIGAVLGEETTLIDSAVETALGTETLVIQKNLRNASGRRGKKRFFVTDSPNRFREVGARFLGEDIDDIELIDI